MTRPLLLNRRRLLAVSAGAALGAVFGCSRSNASNRGNGLEEDGGALALDSGGGRAYPAADARSSPAYPDIWMPDEGDSGVVITPACRITDKNILGPYYREGAPFRFDISDGEPGDPLTISGVVLASDLCTPLPGAIVDVWQANASGAYDNAGYTLRGRIRTDYSGRYVFRTIFPGRYLNGSTYRPAHVHYRVSHPNNVDLTTQLYFSGDPFNATDPFIVDSLIMPVTETWGTSAVAREVRFDIVLA